MSLHIPRKEDISASNLHCFHQTSYLIWKQIHETECVKLCHTINRLGNINVLLQRKYTKGIDKTTYSI